MDFKIAGNETGITTFQLDIKSEGLTLQVLQDALWQAKRSENFYFSTVLEFKKFFCFVLWWKSGRLRILEEMKQCINEPRKLKDSIPKIMEFKILPEALGKVIGPKGFCNYCYQRWRAF